MSYVARTLLAATFLLGCDAANGPDDSDDENVGGKADGVFGIEDGSAEGNAILRVANESSVETLDIDVGLDSRAAQAIVDRRPADGYATLADLDRVPFVASTAFRRLLDFVVANDLVGRKLAIATFNIRWFGLNGDVSGVLGSETRVDSVKRFIESNLGDRDVIVFEEIVDVDLFTEEVMPNHTCITYEGFDGKHQHVMLCHTDAYELRLADDDSDFAFDALKIGNVRPGLHGTLVADDGEAVAHVIAVHLKADPGSTARRLEQARVLAARVEELRKTSDLPIITIGDFNTHLAVNTGLEENDEDLIGEILDALKRVALPVTFTYQEKDGTQFRLDQAYLSPEIEVENVASFGPCDTPLETNEAAVVEHFDTLSDHCPLSFDLRLP